MYITIIWFLQLPFLRFGCAQINNCTPLGRVPKKPKKENEHTRQTYMIQLDAFMAEYWKTATFYMRGAFLADYDDKKKDENTRVFRLQSLPLPVTRRIYLNTHVKIKYDDYKLQVQLNIFLRDLIILP
jgi:hypothetical protein